MNQHMIAGHDCAITRGFYVLRSRSRRGSIPILRTRACDSSPAESATEGGNENEFCESFHYGIFDCARVDLTRDNHDTRRRAQTLGLLTSACALVGGQSRLS